MVTVPIRGEASPEALTEAKALILGALATDREVGIDVSGASGFSPTLPQFLIAAQASAKAKDKRLLFPGLINTDLVKMAMDLGIPRPEEAGDEWPW